jgi:hypothetical protein
LKVIGNFGSFSVNPEKVALGNRKKEKIEKKKKTPVRSTFICFMNG